MANVTPLSPMNERERCILAPDALNLTNVHSYYGDSHILHGVSFALQPGRVYGLLGENGAGKSTLMKIAAGYEAPSAGELHIDGKPVQFTGSRAAEAEGIVLIHQEFNLAEDLTVVPLR